MVATVSARFSAHALAGRPGKRLESLRCDGLPEPIKRTLGPLSVRTGLVSRGFQLGNTVFQHRVSEIGNAVLDRVVEPPKLGVSFGRALAQGGDMRRSALRALLPTVEHGRQDFLEARRLQKAALDVIGNERVELLHRHGAAHAAGFALTGFGGACVVAVSSAFSGPQRHRLAAHGTEADAGKEGGTAYDTGRGQRGAAGLEVGLHSLELRDINDWWRRHFHHLGVRLALAGFPELGIEPVSANVGRAGQHLVHGAEAPATTIAGADAGGVEVLGDVLDAHRPRRAVALSRQAEDQPHGLGLDGVDLQDLLGAVAVLLGRLADAVADRRQRAVPEALPRVLLHGPQRVLRVLLGLVFVEQRHDLSDHVAHRIVAELLGDRDQAHAILGQPPNVKLKLELVAEEAAEAVHQDHIERRRFSRGGVDHPLELGPPVIGRGDAELHEVGDDLPTA